MAAQTMTITAGNLRVGHKIRESRNTTEVTKVSSCGGDPRTKVHINNKDCYEKFAPVEILL